MAAESDKLVVTLSARRGNRYDESGECVGTHGRSIVFLPNGTKPDEQVRVELIPLRDRDGNERKDNRGRTMYRANPAPDASGEKWSDNGDGRASRVETTTDWRGNTRETGVAETRPLGKREGVPGTRSSLRVVWGPDLAESVVEDSPVRVIPLEEERVSGGNIEWVRTGERTETLPTERHGITSLTVDTWCDWCRKRLEPAYQDGASVKATVGFRRPDRAWDDSHSEASTWAAMPQWWREEQEKLYPVCTCGRQRIDTKGSQDGYPKCETCRGEEACGRCGKTGRVTQIENRLICATCEPMERQEAQIAQHVPAARRAELAFEAKRLAAGEAYEGAAGEVLLRALTGQEKLDQKFAGYPWYYFTGDGAFGSRFAPIHLGLVGAYDQAAGDGLVEMTAWLAGPHRNCYSDYRGDWQQSYWYRTQVAGETAEPSLGERDLEQLAVAVLLRGSEGKRQEARERLGKIRSRISPRRAEPIEKILADASGDYAKALALISPIEALLARQDAGEILVDFGGYFRRMGNTGNADFWVIRSDGTCRDPDDRVGRRRYEESEGEKRWELVQDDELAISWAKPDTASPHEFRVVHRPATLTDEQRQVVARLEDEIAREWTGRVGMSGTETPGIGAGWNDQLGHRQVFAERFAAIREACSRSRVLRAGLPQHHTLESVIQPDGAWISEDELRGRCWDHVNWTRPFDVKIGRRDVAQVAERLPAGDGVVEILALEPERRDDHPRFHIRWRRTSEGTQDATPSPSEGVDDRLNPQAIALAQAAERLVGRDRAAAVFTEKREANYGFRARQAEVGDEIPGLKDESPWFFSLHRAGDLDEALADALRWWKHQAKQSATPVPAPAAAKPKPAPKPAVPAVPAADLAQVDLSKLFGGAAKDGRRKK